MPPEQYIAEFAALDSAGGFDNDVLRQVWGKSFWLNKMFRRVQHAILCIIVGTALLLAALLLLYGYPAWLDLDKHP